MRRTQILYFSLFLLLGILLGSYARQSSPESAGGGSGESGGARNGARDGARDGGEDQEAVVEFLKATAGSLESGTTYTGTTEPQQQVGVRSQITAQLLNLTVEVGDRVAAGEVIAQLDPTLLKAAVQSAQAELAAREVELAQARTEFADAQTTINQASAELAQAQSDASRLRSLARQGAIAQQQAELAETTLQIAQQTFQSTQAQARTREQAIAAAQQRVAAQAAVVTQEIERLSYTNITAPIAGVVLARLVETGDLMQSGQELVTLGDIRDTKVVIQVSDQIRDQVSAGQPVQVQIDAFPARSFAGTVERVSPVADPASRLLPVEISLATDEALGSGLLARVNLSDRASSVLVPEGAIAAAEPSAAKSSATIFVVAQKEGASGDRLQVRAQPVQIGTANNGQVEITSGLTPGEIYVAKSSQPLTDGQQVRRSLVSEF